MPRHQALLKRHRLRFRCRQHQTIGTQCLPHPLIRPPAAMFCHPPDCRLGSKRGKIRALRLISKQPPYHYLARPRGFRRPETAEKPVAGGWFTNFDHERRRTRQYFCRRFPLAALDRLCLCPRFVRPSARQRLSPLCRHRLSRLYPHCLQPPCRLDRHLPGQPPCPAQTDRRLERTIIQNWNSSFQTATKPSFTAILKKPHKCVMIG